MTERLVLDTVVVPEEALGGSVSPPHHHCYAPCPPYLKMAMGRGQQRNHKMATAQEGATVPRGCYESHLQNGLRCAVLPEESCRRLTSGGAGGQMEWCPPARCNWVHRLSVSGETNRALPTFSPLSLGPAATPQHFLVVLQRTRARQCTVGVPIIAWGSQGFLLLARKLALLRLVL